MQNQEFIEIEPNVRLHIRDWGQGKTIVFIPGWPLSHEMYKCIAKRLGLSIEEVKRLAAMSQEERVKAT